VLNLPDETVKRIVEVAPSFTRDQLLHVIELLAAAEEQLRYAVSPQVTLEVALIKLVRSRDRVPLESVLDRIDALRSQGPLSTGAPQPDAQRDLFSDGKKKPSAPRPMTASPGPSSPRPAQAPPPMPVSYPQPKAASSSVLEPLSDDERSEFGDLWTRVLRALDGQDPRLRTAITAGCILSFEDNELLIGFDEQDVYHYEQVSKRQNRGLIEDFLTNELGHLVRVTVTCVSNGGVAPAEAPQPRAHPLADDPLVRRSIELFGGKLIQPRR
jgi:hypothetical protein